MRVAGGFGPANGCNSFGRPPFTYTVAANGAQIANTTLEAMDGDYAVLEIPSPIAADTLTITVTPVAEYTTELISCAISIGDGFGDIVEPSIDGGSATFDTDADQDIECWVYNVSRTAEDPANRATECPIPKKVSWPTHPRTSELTPRYPSTIVRPVPRGRTI
ncbi:MAG: hypothetical protein WKF81_02955 [Thermomicrobiales bacterium]